MHVEQARGRRCYTYISCQQSYKPVNMTRAHPEGPAAGMWPSCRAQQASPAETGLWEA